MNIEERPEQAIARMSLVQKELAGFALPEEEDRLHQNPRAWKEALGAMYRDLCNDFQVKKAESVRIGNVVARNEYETWKVQANRRKEALVAKLLYVKGLIREEAPSGKPDYWERQIGLLTDILDELRFIRGAIKP